MHNIQKTELSFTEVHTIKNETVKKRTDVLKIIKCHTEFKIRNFLMVKIENLEVA